MALDIPSRLKSYFRQKFPKTGRHHTIHIHTHPSIPNEIANEKQPASPTPATQDITIETTDTSSAETVLLVNEQEQSPFFQSLPPELRKMIYAHVWQGRYDHMYHESHGRHLHFKNGRWIHTRCVMYPDDDDDNNNESEKTDLIQTQMDLIHYSGGAGDLLSWQRRLASTWGPRHWRCEERVEHGEPTGIDRTDLGALMVVCKKMHPEILASFLETHKLIFNDLYSAYRFLVQRPSSSSSSSSFSPSPLLLQQIRNLDLTLSVPFHWFLPFVITDDGTEKKKKKETTKTNHLHAILTAIAETTTCLHTLRISLDVYDRGPWRELPERGLAAALARIEVRRKGQTNYTVELPPVLPSLSHKSESLGDGDRLPFRVVRRPVLRYWQFYPGEVEGFRWEVSSPGMTGEQQHCCVAVSKNARYVASLDPVYNFVER